MVPSVFRVGLPVSIDLIKKIPYNYAYRPAQAKLDKSSQTLPKSFYIILVDNEI